MNTKTPINFVLSQLLQNNDLEHIKKELALFYDELKNIHTDKDGNLSVLLDQKKISIRKDYLIGEIQQIIDTQTIERTHYYLQRLIKALSEIKTSKINDLNLNRWKQYDDILTDSLWLHEKRDNSGAHSAGYWGNFIPQIPNQLLRRYTKKGEWVLDTFLGSGTTLIECKKLGRNGIGIELQEQVAYEALAKIRSEKDPHQVETKVCIQDSTQTDYRSLLQNAGIQSVQFVMVHPPYWDIIQFSENKADLSNASSMDDFLTGMNNLFTNVSKVLDQGRYMALIISDKYSKGEWIPLGFYTMQEAVKSNFRLKSVVVKNFEETKGKFNQKELWRYRALVGGFYVFKHEYVFIFEKI